MIIDDHCCRVAATLLPILESITIQPMLNVVRQPASWKPDTSWQPAFQYSIPGKMSPSWAYFIYSLPPAGLCLARPPLLTPITMLPRRSSKDTTQDHVSPQSTNDSTRGRRPLSVVTVQRPFRASTTLTIETESPVSETSPQELPPIPPPQPAVRPRLLPGIGGLRRQSTRRDTHDTLASAPEEHDPPQPQPLGMPGLPISQIPEYPPPAPTQPRQRAPGGGVGGFTPPASPCRTQSRDCSHYSTADYTYRFDTVPSLLSHSSPLHYESAGISEGIHAKVWPTYNKISQQFDEKRLVKWNADLDVLLIFVSLMVEGGQRFRSG